jgi:hypothetical protein
LIKLYFKQFSIFQLYRGGFFLFGVEVWGFNILSIFWGVFFILGRGLGVLYFWFIVGGGETP